MKLYQHQELALNYMRFNDSFALFMDMGTGKTLILLCRIMDLLKSGDIENALIVAPKATMGAWYRDCELFDTEDRLFLEKSITVINYDMVWRKGKGYDKQWIVSCLMNLIRLRIGQVSGQPSTKTIPTS